MGTQDGYGGTDMPVRVSELRPPEAAKLLVIDDVAVHRMIICKTAHKAGYATLEASDVATAIDLVADETLTCVTLDLSLGERAGVDVLQQLADLGRTMPVIIISGADAKGAQAAFDLGVSLGLGMQPPISKPVDLMKLREMLTRLELDWRVSKHSFAPVA